MKSDTNLSDFDRKVLSRLRRGRCSSFEIQFLLERANS
jgi:hypothetical protein